MVPRPRLKFRPAAGSETRYRRFHSIGNFGRGFPRSAFLTFKKLENTSLVAFFRFKKALPSPIINLRRSLKKLNLISTKFRLRDALVKNRT